MIVPIDLLKPILDDLLTLGRPNHAAAAVARPLRHRDRGPDRGRGLADGGPAQRADLRTGDVVLAVAGAEVARSRRAFPQGLVARQRRRRGAADDLPRRRDLEPRVTSGDRNRFLKAPSLH